jgi:hypothetical protein
LAVPAGYRQRPLRVALEAGFHSLIAFLLQHETDQAGKDAALREALWANRPALMELALEHGDSVHAVRFQDVIETWDRPIAVLFLRHAADPVMDAPLARAFKRVPQSCRRDRGSCDTLPATTEAEAVAITSPPP